MGLYPLAAFKNGFEYCSSFCGVYLVPSHIYIHVSEGCIEYLSSLIRCDISYFSDWLPSLDAQLQL